MKATFYQQQISTLLGMVEENKGDQSDHTESLPVTDFTDPEKLLLEKEMFRRLPILVAHSSELTKSGDYIVRELDGRSWLLVRGKDGQARAFFNYCQHRGTKLVQDQGGCKQRFSCPYHAWTYDAQGALVGVPRGDLFPGLDKSTKGLKPADLQEKFGFLWLTQDADAAQPVENFVEGIREEMEELDLGSHHVYFDKTRDINCNWKFPLFAFLESYHIATLHKDSIAEFFIENVAHTERHGPHTRSFVPRKSVVELANLDLENVNIAEYITPTNILFPNICMIAHPTSYSILSMFPGETPGTASWRHILLVPELPKSEKERAHFDKTVRVLDEGTYKNEDFWVSEQLQEGINAGAIDELLLGKNETLIKEFADTVSDYLPSST